MPLESQTTVKQRAVRIPLDYFRRRSALDRWKSGLAAVALMAALAYVAWITVGSGRASRYSPGPLAEVHAMWNNRCEVCHQSFIPTAAGAWSGNPHAADALCQSCHRGVEHSSHQIAAEVVSCTACHSEHHGQTDDLIRVADAQCTTCHADIAAHLTPDSLPLQPPLANVSSFVSEHPDFRSAHRDPGQVKFSHSRHLRPGLTFGKNPLTLYDLAPADRQRYRLPGQADNDLVALNCSSCHLLDRTAAFDQTTGPSASSASPEIAAALSSVPVRPAGDYMLPISYALHCQACHQLTSAGPAKPAESSPENSARYLAANQNEVVPHGWNDEQLQRYLTQMLDMRFINRPDHNLLAAPLASAVQQPLEKWRLPNRPPKSEELPDTVGEYLNDELQAAIKNVRLQCLECHQMSPQPNHIQVQQVSTRTAWLEYAKFSHVAHRAVSCQACHGGAYPEELPTEPMAIETLDGDNVFLPGRQLCLQCHSPAQGSGAEATGGARFDCVECHGYHHGDSPWHGPGDALDGAIHEVSVKDFINGENRP